MNGRRAGQFGLEVDHIRLAITILIKLPNLHDQQKPISLLANTPTA